MKLIKYFAYKQKQQTMNTQQLTQSLISLLERNGAHNSNSILIENLPVYVLGLTQESAELIASTIENREAIPLGLDLIDGVRVEELPIFISKDFLASLIPLIEAELNDVANTSELIEKLRSTLTVEELKAVKLREIIEAKDSEIRECKDEVSAYVENIEELKNKISTLSNTAEYDKLIEKLRNALTVEELKVVKLNEIIEAKDSEIKECKNAVSSYVENIEELKNKISTLSNTTEYDKLIEKLKNALKVEELTSSELREIIEAKDSEIKECKNAVSMYVENIEELKNKISTLSNTAEYDKLHSDYKRAVSAVNEKNELIDKIKSMGLIKRIFSLPKLLK